MLCYFINAALFLPLYRDFAVLLSCVHFASMLSAAAQKARSQQQSAAQTPGKRDKIAFASSSSSTAQSRSSQSRTIASAPSKKDVKEKRDARKYDPYNGENRHKKPGTRW
jgi:hypothetical protein